MTDAPGKQLLGMIALITGAGRGIGSATARLFAREGARVVLVSRHEDELLSVADSIEKECGSGSALVLPGDVSDEALVYKMFQNTLKSLGPVDILINNAGILKIADLIDQEVADWDQTMAVNVRGTFLCSREAFRHMKTSGRGGSIVNVSSLAGIRSVEKFPGMGAYIASKHAVIGLTESLVVEGKPLGIRVNCIAPGAVDTQLVRKAFPDFQVTTQPEEIARTIFFLADTKQSGSMTGSILEVHCNP